MTTLVQEKVRQAHAILQELDIDLWMTFVRETSAGMDPVLPLLLGHDVTWQSAFILTKRGESIAIMGRYDAENAHRSGAYGEVIGYDQSFKEPLLAVLNRLNPAQIALNYSLDDTHADGLGHGLYLLLQNYLAGTPFRDRLLSAEKIISALRGRKTDEEIRRVREAIRVTYEIYDRTFAFVEPGKTEAQVGAHMHRLLDEMGLTTSWERANCPAVNSGHMPAGHAGPTDLVIERGHLVHFDFGLCKDDYCSDIQRVLYLLREDEREAPEPVRHGFETIVAAIRAAVDVMRPGVLGHEVDAVARKVVTDAGYPAYKYATGHQVGRAAHDGGGTLAPLWERYGDTPKMALEVGQIYAVEPGLMVEGYGYLGIEENVLITEAGAIFLGEPQTALIVK
jgi:Xaa-Pro aminopeptidase